MDQTLITHDKQGRPLQFAKEMRTQYHENSRYDSLPSQEDLACELQLTALGVWEPLDFVIDPQQYREDMAAMSQWWRPFQPKQGMFNDRDSIMVYGPPNSEPWDPCGLAQMAAKLGYKPDESTMCYPTEARQRLTCLRPVFDYFEDFGRSFLIRLNQGGHYPPHRDHIALNRPTFRLIAFLGDRSQEHLRWEVEDRPQTFTPYTVYYVDTRKLHRLWSSAEGSTMMVFNLKKNWLTVRRLMSRLQHG